PFRKTSLRCPNRSSSWKLLPVPDFSSGNTDRRLVSFDRLQLPNQRTKLLTPSVASAGVQGLVNYNDRVLHYASRFFRSMHYFSFSTRIFTAVKKCGKRCTYALAQDVLD